VPTRNVVLTEHHERIITKLVGSGRYQNASEVLRDGLRLIEERDTREAAKLEALQAAASTGFADLDEGRYRELSVGEVSAVIGELGEQPGLKIRSRP